MKTSKKNEKKIKQWLVFHYQVYIESALERVVCDVYSIKQIDSVLLMKIREVAQERRRMSDWARAVGVQDWVTRESISLPNLVREMGAGVEVEVIKDNRFFSLMKVGNEGVECIYER